VSAVIRILKVASRRRWSSWVMASVVILGLGDSKLVGLVTPGDYVWAFRESIQSNRAEQKAPRDLSTTFIFAKTQTLRAPFCNNVRPMGSFAPTQPFFVIVASWTNSFSIQPHFCETTRGPPSIDPTLLS